MSLGIRGFGLWTLLLAEAGLRVKAFFGLGDAEARNWELSAGFDRMPAGLERIEPPARVAVRGLLILLPVRCFFVGEA